MKKKARKKLDKMVIDRIKVLRAGFEETGDIGQVCAYLQLLLAVEELARTVKTKDILTALEFMANDLALAEKVVIGRIKVLRAGFEETGDIGQGGSGRIK